MAGPPFGTEASYPNRSPWMSRTAHCGGMTGPEFKQHMELYYSRHKQQFLSLFCNRDDVDEIMLASVTMILNGHPPLQLITKLLINLFVWMSEIITLKTGLAD